MSCDDRVLTVMGGMGWRWARSVLAASLLFYWPCYSDQAPNYSFLRHATAAPPTAFYDYIVVGGGTAGCALGATLSSGARVLVLERGGSPYGNPHVQDVESFAADLADATPLSPAQQFVSKDGVYSQRPRVLGGGSAINAGFYTRASPRDVAESGWDAAEVDRAFRWVEEKVAFQPEPGPWQAAVKAGLLEAGVVPDNGFTYDHIHGTKIGGSIFDRNGHRHTAADLLEYADPTQITVYLHAVVHKILFTPKPRAHGVIFKDAAGIMHSAFLKGDAGEIVLSAGALGSPQLMMLSGIGPKDHLLAHGIPVVMDQPMVGQGMADNPMNAIMVGSRRPVEVSLIQTVGIAASDDFYVEAASGVAFGRLDPNAAVPSPVINGAVILEKISGPRSSGHLRLLTRDPSANPAVSFNYFQDPEDLRACVAGMETVMSVYRSDALSEFRHPLATAEAVLATTAALPLNLRPRHLTTGLSLERFCRDTVLTIWHYHGGCRKGAVVDGEYRVVGVEALRVVDGSTFNRSPGTNPQATVMMLGRYVGERMLKERKVKVRE